MSRDFCPFQVQGLCIARESRPLGCRIYFCDPAFQEQQHTITETAVAKLKTIADEFDTGWNYAPLHAMLNAAEPSRGAVELNVRVPLSVLTDV